MFDLFLPSKQDEDIDPEHAKANIAAINAALKSCLTAKKFKLLGVTKKDMDIEMNILPTLKILEEGITKIGDEKYSTGSLVLPFLTKFLVLLDGNEEDQMYVQMFKKDLQGEMITRCKDNLNIEVLALISSQVLGHPEEAQGDLPHQGGHRGAVPKKDGDDSQR